MQHFEKKWTLESYSKWINNSWNTVYADINNNTAIFILNSQLSVVIGNTCQESFSLAQNKNGIVVSYMDKTLVFYSLFNSSGWKFRILFKTQTDAKNCAEILEKHFKLLCKEENTPVKNEKTYSEMLTELMKNVNQLPAPRSIPDDYPLESAIKLCVLDPGFSNLVTEVEKIINN